MIKTANFDPRIDKKICCTCGDIECDQRSINQTTLDMLQKVREDFGRAMIITSGGRCPFHPSQRSKVDPNSGDHPRGDGVDIAVSDRQTYDRIALLAGRHGFNAIGDGLEMGFIHLGRRENNGRKVSSWGY